MPYINPIPSIGKQTKNTLFEEQQNYIRKEKVYFAFIDVLGFQKSYDDKKLTKNDTHIQKYQDVFNYYFELMNSAKLMKSSDNNCYAGQTSDSLYFYTERLDFLVQFIHIFSHFTLYAMSKDVFFRGGISQGELFKKENYQFFGDCVIGAYLLENKISKFPIITIDEKTYADLQTFTNVDDMICASNNHRYYIKPFYFLKENIQLEMLHDFKLKNIENINILENILKNKSIFEYNADNFAKYTFLEDEYNKCIKSQNTGILGGENE